MVDDPKIRDITAIQWTWYAQVISNEIEEKYVYERDILEYHASFWNAEAVLKVRDNRDRADDDRFMSDEEFNRSIESGEYHKGLDMIKKMREEYSPTNLNTNNERVSARDVKLPSDKASISKLINKKFD